MIDPEMARINISQIYLSHNEETGEDERSRRYRSIMWQQRFTAQPSLSEVIEMKTVSRKLVFYTHYVQLGEALISHYHEYIPMHDIMN